MRVAAVLLMTMVLGTAHGDSLRATLGGPIVEVSHEVEVTLAGGVALYRVTRVFANPGERADEATVEITLPYGAAATAMRIRARDRWYDADLLPAKEAAERYEKLTSMGPYQPKDPALLAWLWSGDLLLRVFPVFPGGASTVEYTLVAPTRYDRGRYLLSYPRAAGARLAPPVLRVQPAWGDALLPIHVDERRLPPGSAMVLAAPDAGGVPEGVPDAAGWAASELEVPAEQDGAVARAEIELAVEHTYRSDLKVFLVAPGGARVPVVSGTGGGENDLRGKFPVTLPAGTRAAGVWRLVVYDDVGLDSGTLEAWSLRLTPKGKKPVSIDAADLPRFVPDAQEGDEAGLARIVVDAPAIDTVAGRLGRVTTGGGPELLRLELDVAAELRPLPRAAQVVFVLDASYSLGEERVLGQLAAARAYLAHVPDASAEIVAFRRRASRVFGKMTPAARWDDAVGKAWKAGRFGGGNGSALDEGLTAAATVLAGTRGPRRVVVLTDARFRSAWPAAVAALATRTLPPDTVVHVVVVGLGDDGAELARDDNHAYAGVPAATGGIWARLDGAPGDARCLHQPATCADAWKRLARPVLGLVRPVQLDDFQVTGLPAKLADDEVLPQEILREGTAYRGFIVLRAAPTRVALEGKLWSQKWRRDLEVDGKFSRQAAGFVFGEDEHGDLDERQQMVVARFGHVVSPVTSLLAVEPGTRPSTIGLDRIGVGSGSGSGFGSGQGYGGTMGVRPPALASLIGPIARRCAANHRAPAGWKPVLDVELTSWEIVDVARVDGEAGPAMDCLIEGVWALELPHSFRDARRTERVTL